MITIQTQSDGVLFNFQDSTRYLYGGGSILTPYNSLTLIADESNVLTFRKSASNDIFITAGYDELGYSSKEEAINDLKTKLFKATGGGGSESGITSGEVQTMIDNSLEDYYTDDEVDAALSGKADARNVYTIAETNYLLNDLSQRKADTSAVTAVANDVSTLSGQVATKVNTTDFNAYSAATDARLAEDEEVTAAALNNLDERIGDPYQKVSGLTIEANEEENFPFIRIEAELEDGNSDYTFINDAGIDSTFENNTEGSYYSSSLGQGTIGNYATDFPDDNVTSERNLEITTDGFRQTTYENYDDGENGYTRYSSENEFNYSNGLTLSQQWYDPENDETTNSSLNIINNGEGETYIELTDVDENSVKIETTGITINGDAVATEPYVDDVISGKVDTSAITTEITSGSTDSEIPTAKAVYDAIPTGGGATYSAGTNISIDTANTINCTLNLINGTGSHSLVSNGPGNTATKESTFSFGQNLTSSRMYGVSFGLKNVFSESGSQYTFGESGNTLFSIGNGNRNGGQFHNALDIRQNGDIYFSDTDNTTYQNYYEKPMVRLQDMYGALGGLKLVKLTQSEYEPCTSYLTLFLNHGRNRL